ncbi:FtsB family cell division protein [Mariluticola halotolerans]|uniref:FtsB family cell division protein n=1 Tax=Mariluticola halotolerans TaxID=2909283 RepID=UPI0026E44383|nr:septum formation initiator family protein [Mariluticola halotolerans]UJQ94983.1 septum formation initiator family protein [Mariluticola halotolerans]
MPTRLKKPSIVKQLGITVLLVSFQAYLGYSAISGQYGIESRNQMHADIIGLKAHSARLQAEMDSYTHRISLFDSENLDPDILTERALALLSMVNTNDRVVMLPDTGNKL